MVAMFPCFSLAILLVLVVRRQYEHRSSVCTFNFANTRPLTPYRVPISATIDYFYCSVVRRWITASKLTFRSREVREAVTHHTSRSLLCTSTLPGPLHAFMRRFKNTLQGTWCCHALKDFFTSKYNSLRCARRTGAWNTMDGCFFDTARHSPL
ncbi:hypothetical protein BDN71DRAFT_1021856 [Pleurotus eryngii]|uniref:Secreted protein n=1 Tax=Pleurotus eryngii TaxID=5323 RepID=A0A9P6DFM2_PLEER|nr:hypothetical protein BDN71DRAFT_1021856 [Pleurotus eryngii]